MYIAHHWALYHMWFQNKSELYIYIYIYHTIIRAAFVCVFVCFLSPSRSFGWSSPNLVGVCRWTSHLPLRGSFSKRSRGWRVNGSLSLSTILYMRQPHSTRCNGAFCSAVVKQQSLILRLFLQCISTLYVGAHRNCYWGVLFLKGQRDHGSTGQRVNGSNGSHLNRVCTWTSQLPWGILFRKGQQVNGSNGSTGRRVSGSNRSTGQQVTFTFTILYMIADDARLTPPRCKKHTPYDDTRLTPRHCKKHTASFARSTVNFLVYM